MFCYSPPRILEWAIDKQKQYEALSPRVALHRVPTTDWCGSRSLGSAPRRVHGQRRRFHASTLASVPAPRDAIKDVALQCRVMAIPALVSMVLAGPCLAARLEEACTAGVHGASDDTRCNLTPKKCMGPDEETKRQNTRSGQVW